MGIDPHPGLLAAWGLSDDAAGLRDFSLTVIDALGGQVAALKPQSALFERHGSAGIAVLEEVVAVARSARTLTIVDAKRGDIGSTMAAYADAYLRDGSPLAGDALTVSPYLGFGSLAPALDMAHATGRGLFVLCLTSNAEGVALQHARDGDTSVAGRIALGAASANRTARDHGTLGSIGLVVGATIGDGAHEAGIDLAAVNGPLLAPGVGAQGAGGVSLLPSSGRHARTSWRPRLGACSGQDPTREGSSPPLDGPQTTPQPHFGPSRSPRKAPQTSPDLALRAVHVADPADRG